MDEPLLGEGPLSVDVDREARLATVRTQLPGPAGTAGLDLGGALELDIDLARPASLAGLTIELPTTGDTGRLPRSVRRRLDALLGAPRTEQVAASVRAAGETSGGEPWPLAGVGSAGVAPSLQRASLAHAAACEAGAPLLVRAAGLIEAAVALDPIASCGLLDLRATAHHDAQAGADLLLRLAARGSATGSAAVCCSRSSPSSSPCLSQPGPSLHHIKLATKEGGVQSTSTPLHL